MNLNIKTRQVDADEFKEYTGIDLASELAIDDNPSNQVNAFLEREQTFFDAYIDSKLFYSIENGYPKLTDYQKKQYKLAVLEQLLYILKNGNVLRDSGYNINKGTVASKTEINMRYLSEGAKIFLQNAGIWTTNLQGRLKYGRGFIF